MKKIFALLLTALLLIAGSTFAEEAKVRVGISWVADFEDGVPDEDTQAYIDSVTMAGGEPVYLPQVTDAESAKAALALVDCLILTGGEDIDPALYGEEPADALEEVNAVRDTSDIALAKAALDAKFPTLATCRGMQVLNTIMGGTLYQDIPTQYESDTAHRSEDLIDFAYHPITVSENSLLAKAMGGAGAYEVNSWHHQGIKTVGAGLVVTATAQDGMIEALEIPNADFFMLAVQFHPEWHAVEHDGEYLSVLQALMNAAKP